MSAKLQFKFLLMKDLNKKHQVRTMYSKYIRKWQDSLTHPLSVVYLNAGWSTRRASGQAQNYSNTPPRVAHLQVKCPASEDWALASSPLAHLPCFLVAPHFFTDAAAAASFLSRIAIFRPDILQELSGPAREKLPPSERRKVCVWNSAPEIY